MNWKPIKIDELMIFYAIIIQMACRPFPGKRYDECWNYTQDWFTNCKQMNKTRFKQIRAALHWCDNPHSTSKEDTLYKVRPMINILERTIGMYLEVGPEIALDETTIGLYQNASATVWPQSWLPLLLHLVRYQLWYLQIIL